MLSACSSQHSATIDPQPNPQAGRPAAETVVPAPRPATRPATPQETTPAGTRTAPVVPGRPGRVFIFAGLATDCKPLPPPALTITAPPRQGDVSFRPGQTTTIATSSSGTCKGVKATGTGVYYTARHGSAGQDSFTVSARMPTGETMTRQFTVDIAN